MKTKTDKAKQEELQISPETLFIEFIKNSAFSLSEAEIREKKILLDKADFFTKGKGLILSNYGG